MALPNVFTKEVADSLIARINTLTPESKAQWGKMSVAQMLAHCNVTYEYVYEDKYAKPNVFMRFIMKTLVKKTVISEEPYKHNGNTGPDFIIKNEPEFVAQKNRLIGFITKTQELGASHFEGKESHSFGALTATEWNNMFYKHLNHHLGQFGV
jgi:hypothetical protein